MAAILSRPQCVNVGSREWLCHTLIMSICNHQPHLIWRPNIRLRRVLVLPLTYPMPLSQSKLSYTSHNFLSELSIPIYSPCRGALQIKIGKAPIELIQQFYKSMLARPGISQPSPSWVAAPSHWAPSQYKDRFPGMGIRVLKIRRSWDRLIFDMAIIILVRRHLYIETAPWSRHRCCTKAITLLGHNGGKLVIILQVSVHHTFPWWSLPEKVMAWTCIFCITDPFIALSSLVGNHRSSVDSPHKGSVMRSFDVSIVVEVNKRPYNHFAVVWIALITMWCNCNIYLFAHDV